MAAVLEIPEPEQTPGIEIRRRQPHPSIRELLIPLPPMPWKRAGFNKKTGAHYTASDRKKRMGEIKLLWAGRRLPQILEREIGAHFEFVFEHDASHFDGRGQLLPEWIGTRPGQNKGDLDNLIKLVKDALNGTAYLDDTMVAELSAEKRWAEGGERAHTRACLWPL